MCTEVTVLGHIAHPNIIRLLGYCKDEPEHLLVYEYMPNKSYDYFLFTDTIEPLSWRARLLIMIGVRCPWTNMLAFGKTRDFNAKLGDFGLVKYGPKTGETHVTTRVMGTYGYAPPEYLLIGHLTTKSDIYGLGVVLMESITGRKAQ
ncbi:putative protein kinase RLK-Pelle-URK-2 family [Helianthus debilis subsp. tardiflorus]